MSESDNVIANPPTADELAQEYLATIDQRRTELEELTKWFRRFTPSSPDWFQAIDHIASMTLVWELERLNVMRYLVRPTPPTKGTQT